MPHKDPEARRKYRRAFYLANREKILATASEYRAKNRERLRKQARIYHQRDPEKARIMNAKWRETHREEQRSYRQNYHTIHENALREYRKRTRKRRSENYRKWYIENTGKKVAYNARWRKNNPDKVIAMSARRRARKRNALLNDLSAAQWKEIKEHYNYHCVYCNKKQKRLTQDHVIPLIKEGNHTYTNVVPACKSCNSKKGAGAPLIPVQPLLLIVS